MPDWANEVMRFTAGTGGPATSTLEQSIRCVAADGNISVTGVLSSMTDESRQGQAIGVSLIRKNATLKGINFGPRDRVEEMIREASHKLHPVIDCVFVIEEGREVLNYLYTGSHVGKVIIQVEKGEPSYWKSVNMMFFSSSV